jgi:exo-beta-1,3-glucanase (GH17 family)/cellulose synthase/poly-beta-1,6-N-acetylglucosamine synthase-like glycosyltransferase
LTESSPPRVSHNSHLSVTALLVTLIVSLLNFALWQWTNRPVVLPDWTAKVNGMAYSGFQRDEDPTKNRFPTEEELNTDMRLLSDETRRIRTYTVTENPAVIPLAAKYGLNVTAGAWIETRSRIDKETQALAESMSTLDDEKEVQALLEIARNNNNDTQVHALLEIARKLKNDREVKTLIEVARNNRHVDRVIVGNESVLRGQQIQNDPAAVKELVGYLREVRGKLRVPVSTAEPPHIWHKYPELARNVDFITVHLLPYWEGLPVNDAVNHAMDAHDRLQRAFRSKPIVIGEVGWPSQGDRRDGAYASIENEAAFVRAFLKKAAERELDYYFMEAFDQPWKQDHEGRAGAYWGLFHADRAPKFPLSGPVVGDKIWPGKALAAALLAAPFVYFFAAYFRRFRFAGKLFFATLIQASVTLMVWIVGVPFEPYLDWFDWAMFFLLLPALIAMIAVLLANAFEFTEVMWRRAWLREFIPVFDEDAPRPFVSVHLACYNEPPDMVILTLESLANLDYENFEVLVLDNNTKDPAVWEPVKAWCDKAGPRFRFFHLENWPGFKAGALNYGLTQTDPRADIVGVVDADYVAERHWLRTLTPHFAGAEVAVVQAPQAHREFEKSAFQRMCNWEFDGFFRIGMHHRNERNAIIQHGTMTLVRKDVLVNTGGWAEWCICEDAELGLRLMNEGLETRYVDAVLGRGLTPADFKAFKSQRTRWAFGAMQILKHRWKWLTRRGKLDGGQRYHFLTGWFSWFADALHLVFTFLALGWTIAMMHWPDLFKLPLDLFLYPIIGFFVCKAFFGPALYRKRVDCSWLDVIGASVASMGLSHAIARGVFAGLIQKKGTFIRTAKGVAGGGWLGALGPVREEGLMALALVMAAGAFLYITGTNHREATLWATVLAAQALPYFSSLVCAVISASDAEEARKAQRRTPETLPQAVLPATT